MKPGDEKGFTSVELAFALVIGAGALAVVVGLFSTTNLLARETRATTSVAAEHRRNLTALADAVRGADLASLGGFDVDGVASTLEFRRVTGRNDATPVLGPIEQLQWRQRPTADAGDVAQPGGIWLASPDGDVLLADRVPAGQFSVRQEGRLITISVTTYYPHPTDGSHQVTGTIGVTVRN